MSIHQNLHNNSLSSPHVSRLMLRCARLLLMGLTLVGTATLLPAGPYRPLPALAQNVSNVVGRGYQLLSQDRVNEAIAQFQQALNQNPRDLEAQLGLGIAYRRAGQDEQAFRTYQRVLELDPDNVLALRTLGLLGEFRSEWQRTGIEALTRLLQQQPNDEEALAQRAKLYFYQGLFSQALADYSRVLPSSDLETLRSAAEVYTYSGDEATGLELFERYRSLGGSLMGDVAIAYSQALRENGQVESAIRLLNQALQQEPSFSTQHIRLRGALATAYAANRQYQQALDLVQPLRGRSDSRLTLARALNAIGEYAQQPSYRQEAAELYQNVLSTVNSPSLGLIREASYVFSTLPQYQAASLRLVRQLSQLQPEDASLKLQQQVLEYQTNQLERSALVPQIQAAFPRLPADPVQVRRMAQTLSRLDPPLPELLPLYRSLATSDDTEPFLQFRIAQILLQQGELAAAQSALAAYAQTPAGSRDGGTIQLLLADLERRQGELATSAQRYQAILSSAVSQPIRAGAIQGLASVYQAQGQIQAAIALYDQLISEQPQNISYQVGRTALAYEANLISANQAAQRLQQAAAQLDPDNSSALINLASALPPTPDLASTYQRLLAIEPNNPGLQLRNLQLLASTNPRAALTQVQQLVAQNPQNLDWYLVQAEIARQTDNLALANQSYDVVLQRQPNNIDALLAKAGLAFQEGDYSEADRLYQQAISLEGQNTTARTSLAALMAVQGQSLEAIRQLQALQRQGVTGPELSRQIQQVQENLLLQRGIQPSWERF